MSGKAGVRRSLAGVLLENLPLKLLSLLVSLLFYGYLHGAQNAQRSFSVSVVALLSSDDDGRVLLSDPPDKARLVLTGSKPMLDELKADELGNVQLDLRSPGGSYAPFDLSHLKIPAGVKAEVDPPGLLLIWDAVVVRPVPVQTPLTGQPARGFAVQGTPSPDPSVVSARGPQSLIETLQFARTEPFDVSGLALEGSVTRKLLLEPPPTRVQFLERSVLVTTTLDRARAERLFVKQRVLVVGTTRPSSTSTPTEVDVRISGPPDLVDGLRPEQIVPVADVRPFSGDNRAGALPIPVTVTLEGCTAQVVPPTVVVKW